MSVPWRAIAIAGVGIGGCIVGVLPQRHTLIARVVPAYKVYADKSTQTAFVLVWACNGETNLDPVPNPRRASQVNRLVVNALDQDRVKPLPSIPERSSMWVDSHSFQRQQQKQRSSTMSDELEREGRVVINALSIEPIHHAKNPSD